MRRRISPFMAMIYYINAIHGLDFAINGGGVPFLIVTIALFYLGLMHIYPIFITEEKSDEE